MKARNHAKFHASLLTILVIFIFLVSPLPAGAGSDPGGYSDRLVDPAPSTPTAPTTPVQMDINWGGMPLYFIANQGQVKGDAAYYVQGSDKTLFFNPQGVTFALVSSISTIRKDKGPRGDAGPGGRWTVKLDFVGANSVQPLGQSQTGAVISYFKGPSEDWHTGLPTYSSIIYPDLWAGIDLVYAGTADRLKQEIIVAPGADPAQIRLAYRGAAVRLNKKGQLDVHTPAGGFLDEAPLAWQVVNGERQPVPVEYALDKVDASGGDKLYSYGFRLGAYDPAFPLVIDPEILVYCGYIGGTEGEESTGIDVDSYGNVYVAGYTDSTQATFPVTVGPDLTYNSTGTSDDAFVAKVNATGTNLVYAGYIGGNNRDHGTGIAVDSDGNAYVTGYTGSTSGTFPAIVGPDLSHNGGDDAFVAKVNVDGTGLVFSGYIGGSQGDGAEGIALDSDGNAYITGRTYSYPANGFPLLVGPELTHGGYTDAFVTKVKADGTGLLYSGYIGGGDSGTNGFDEGWGIAVDSDGFAYVTGITSSTEASFPVTVGPDTTYNGGPSTSPWDGFVAKVAVDGSSLVYCGYIGGAQQDYATDIAVDANVTPLGYVYITGYTNSTQTTFPVLVGPDLTYNGDYWDAFVVKVKADGSGLIYSGYIGGSEGDTGMGIEIDSGGNAYITGWAESTEATFPVSGGPDLTHNGYKDAFVAKVKTNGSGLIYSGYIGGSGSDSGHDIALDASGNIYIVGDTGSTQATFPVTVGPDLTFSGYYDAFVAKITHKTGSTLTLRSAGAYDGWILESGENTNIGGTLDSTSTTFNLGDGVGDKQYRAVLSFNTASLPDTAIITKVTLKIKRPATGYLIGNNNPFTWGLGLKVDIRKPFFGTTLGLVVNDFQSVPGKSAAATFSGTPVANWYSAVIGSAGYPYINKTGTTQFRLRFYTGDNDDMDPDYMKFYSGNYTGTVSRPTLIIEYYIP